MLRFKGHQIFLLDAIGAGITLFLLSLVYVFHSFFGMPQRMLVVFLCIASICLAFSATVYLVRPANWRPFLKIIATLNLTYCMYTGYQILSNADTLTCWGYIYFTGELLILLLISLYEYYQAR